LYVYWDGQVDRATSTAECQPHRTGDNVWDSPRIVDHERAFGYWDGHAYLVYFLLGATPKVGQIGTASNGNNGAFGVHGVSQTRNGVGQAWCSVHADAGQPRDPAPGIGHVHGCLLVPGVDETEALIYHLVQQGQDVITSQGKNVGDALHFQRFTNEVTPVNSSHCLLFLCSVI
jgi:hypothetical protein